MTPYYSRDGITLYHADCRDVLATMEFVGTECCVTDPPFGIYSKGGKWGRKNELRWDSEPPEYVAALPGIFDEVIIWGGNYFTLPPSRGWLVWFKRDAVPSAASVELAWTSLDMNSRLIDQTIAATNAERCGHPTQKPLKVMEFSIGFTGVSAPVFDPYAGSCTTGVAAWNLGRKAVLCEISEEYCELGAKRLDRVISQGRLFKPEPVRETQTTLEFDE